MPHVSPATEKEPAPLPSPKSKPKFRYVVGKWFKKRIHGRSKYETIHSIPSKSNGSISNESQPQRRNSSNTTEPSWNDRYLEINDSILDDPSTIKIIGIASSFEEKREHKERPYVQIEPFTTEREREVEAHPVLPDPPVAAYNDGSCWLAACGGVGLGLADDDDIYEMRYREYQRRSAAAARATGPFAVPNVVACDGSFTESILTNDTSIDDTDSYGCFSDGKTRVPQESTDLPVVQRDQPPILLREGDSEDDETCHKKYNMKLLDTQKFSSIDTNDNSIRHDGEDFPVPTARANIRMGRLFDLRLPTLKRNRQDSSLESNLPSTFDEDDALVKNQVVKEDSLESTEECFDDDEDLGELIMLHDSTVPL